MLVINLMECLKMSLYSIAVQASDNLYRLKIQLINNKYHIECIQAPTDLLKSEVVDFNKTFLHALCEYAEINGLNGFSNVESINRTEMIALFYKYDPRLKFTV